jgi:hypothetical protein
MMPPKNTFLSNPNPGCSLLQEMIEGVLKQAVNNVYGYILR